MNQLTQRMSGTLTVDQTEKLTKTGYDLLDRFDMVEHGDDTGPDDMLDSYVSALKVECRSQKTIDRYVYVIGKLMDFAKVPTRRISVYHLRNYLTQEKERGICENTLEGYREIFSAYFNWLQRESLIDRNPCTNLGVIKVPKAEGVNKVRVHILIDGRDVGETSALDYIEPFEAFIADLRDANFDIKIASGGGRMQITMDRYEADWSMVERGWHTHVLGDARQFASAAEAVKTYRDELKVIDQDLPPFVIAEDGKPVGTIEDGDSVIFFNFRGDRSIEISKTFDDADFNKFDRVRYPKVVYAGMLEYDGDLHIPSRYLVNPPEITNTMSEYMANTGINVLAISETQKYGHVTYFWNGNKSGKFSETLETYIEIPSDTVPFEQRPWMKCAEITDALIEALESGKYEYLRVNFPNGDMVGHTGSLAATRCSVEALDIQLARILKVLDKMGGVALITADHGNADEMYEMDKKSGQPKADKNGNFKAKTSHTLNPVPCIIYDNVCADKYTVKADNGQFGLSNVAATMVNLMGYEAPDMWDESIIEVK